nr:PRA1 family protein E [Fagopyrum tataricum]
MPAKPAINYGSIPSTTSSTPSSSDPFVTRLGRETRALSHTLRPWRELFSVTSLSLPIGYQDAMSRVRRNLRYYRFNYSFIVLLVVFLSLLWHPISMIVFIVVFLLWLFLYFSRDEPIVVFGRDIDDRLVLLGLSIMTVLVLVLTHVGLNVLVSLVIGVFIVGLHAAFRSCDDQFLDVEEVAEGGALAGEGLVSFGGGARPMRSFGRPI